MERSSNNASEKKDTKRGKEEIFGKTGKRKGQREGLGTMEKRERKVILKN